MKIPARIPILWLILGVLLFVSVVPMYFYATRVVAINRDRLKTNEMLLQNTITRSLGDEIAQREKNLLTMLGNFSAGVQASSGGDLSGDRVNAPQLMSLLENFVSSSADIAYATLVNAESKGISSSRIPPDPFMTRDLERAFAAARDGRAYNGQPLSVGTGRDAHTVMLVSKPVTVNDNFVGMTAAFVDLGYLIARLRDTSQGGLLTYVVDRRGRLVAGAATDYATGQDMTNMEIVRNFVEQGARGRFAATEEFTATIGKTRQQMLGTYKTVPELEWAVVAQKTQEDAYQDVTEMQRTARVLAIIAILMSVGISSFATRKIVTPLQVLAESSKAIAKGDFSQRVDLKSRTEIGELASTFNRMSQDLEQLVADLKRAAEENRTLFLSSIQMLAGAVDEKDPYTRGHSDRVTRYSVLIAEQMGLPPDEVEKVRISAQLHDVGKIGIEDRILKKPGALTPEEFGLMKAHTTKGANILRSVEQLRKIIPGIELHHESLDGRGYPYGLKGDAIPTVARIIMVADTFDAMTTNRPYQAAMDPEYVIGIINSLVNTKFDPSVVAALTAVFKNGGLAMHHAESDPETEVLAGAVKL
ncbi:MAG TPA: HD domain-containing phosphohydrolase [Terriglobales bacterium]|nr:HD domain-containing phosphohydrolase [Terriglobales bacterium]